MVTTDLLTLPIPIQNSVWPRKEPGEWTLWVQCSGYYRYSTKLTLVAGKLVVHEAVLQRMGEGDDPRAGRRGKKSKKDKQPAGGR